MTNPSDLSTKTIHNLFLQQIQTLSIQSHLRNSINLNPVRGEFA